jgi:NADH-quinone oxidoreductase subunit J
MTIEKLIFYFFAAVLVFAAVRVITARNPVHAALFLVLAFCSASGTWLLVHAEFLAIALILVYVGAVMVLFLFVVMMLDINIAKLREGFIRYLPVGILVGVLILVEMILVVRTFTAPVVTVTPVTNVPNIEAIGQTLFTTYIYPFELAAVILLVAMVAAIALTMRPKRQSKYLNPALQVNVHRADRIRLVDLPAESKD